MILKVYPSCRSDRQFHTKGPDPLSNSVTLQGRNSYGICDFIGPLCCFPVATDRITWQSPTVDQGLTGYQWTMTIPYLMEPFITREHKFHQGTFASKMLLNSVQTNNNHQNLVDNQHSDPNVHQVSRSTGLSVMQTCSSFANVKYGKHDKSTLNWHIRTPNLNNKYR